MLYNRNSTFEPQRYNYFLNYARKTQKKLKIVENRSGVALCSVV